MMCQRERVTRMLRERNSDEGVGVSEWLERHGFQEALRVELRPLIAMAAPLLGSLATVSSLHNIFGK